MFKAYSGIMGKLLKWMPDDVGVGRPIFPCCAGLYGVLIFAMFGCNRPNPEMVEPLAGINPVTQNEIPHVQAAILKNTTFEQEIISQGKVQAMHKSEVVFPIMGHIENIFVRTGQKIQKGNLLAQLDNNDLKHECDMLRQDIARAWLQMEAKLVSLGYSMADSSRLSAELWSNLQIENGLPGLRLRLQLAERKLNQTRILAPISGVVANLEAQPNNPTANYKKLCTIIDDENLEVKFPILEAEITSIQTGNSVLVLPLYNPDQTYNAKIAGINPEVDEKGLIWGFARISGKPGSLIEGMKVKVFIKRSIPGQLVVPKSAVVDRQNRQVVFAYKNSQAYWIYVDIINENARQYAIEKSGVMPGDTIIVTNNFDLAHLEQVVLDSIIH